MRAFIARPERKHSGLAACLASALLMLGTVCLAAENRSEERRVGKECRSRGSPDH